MKNFTKAVTRLFVTRTFVLLCCLMSAAELSQAQCTNGTMYPSSAVAMPGVGVTTTISTCQYQSEYNQITGVTASTNFTSTASIAVHLSLYVSVLPAEL